jgi:uncharacterized membrane protein YeaQ/YmgE (transglycosylase-associated protein family)
MDVTSIVTAVVIGLAGGVLGWVLLPRSRTGPVWAAISIGVVAAVIGTALAHAIGVARSPGLNWLELTFQLSFAAAAVAAVAGVSGRRSAGSGSGRAS